MIDSPTSSRHTRAQNYSGGEVAIATVWLVLFLLILGGTVTSEVVSSVIQLAAR